MVDWWPPDLPEKYRKDFWYPTRNINTSPEGRIPMGYSEVFPRRSSLYAGGVVLAMLDRLNQKTIYIPDCIPGWRKEGKLEMTIGFPRYDETDKFYEEPWWIVSRIVRAVKVESTTHWLDIMKNVTPIMYHIESCKWSLPLVWTLEVYTKREVEFMFKPTNGEFLEALEKTEIVCDLLTGIQEGWKELEIEKFLEPHKKHEPYWYLEYQPGWMLVKK